VLQDDRNLVLYAADGPAWSTHTETDAAPPPEPQAAPESAPESSTADGPVVEATEEAFEEANPEPAPEPARTYTVVSGDTLWAIAERFYGEGNKYQVIADASGVSNPDLIYPGQVLTIP
jgi:nucleoid-associated protein YgaU